MKEIPVFQTLEVGSIGYNHSHGKDFVQDYPDGVGCYLLLLIKTPAIFELNKQRHEVEANTFVMISPKTKCRYRPVFDKYTDDWMYFGFDESEKKIFEELAIPFDTPLCLGNIDELSQLIHFISFEHYSSDLHHESIKKQYTQILFYKISRIIQSKVVPSADLFTTKNDRLTYLRTKIYSEPTFFQDVNSMAWFVNLSRSRFQHLYKSTFGVNIMTDVINAKIQFSKKLLETTPLTIAEIAAKSGYKSEYSFMRQFKERTGLTPTEYRKINSR